DVTLMKGGQSPGDFADCCHRVVALEKNLLQRDSRGFLHEEGMQSAQMSNGLSHGEGFSCGIGPPAKCLERLISLFFVAVDLHIEALLSFSACRSIASLHCVAKNERCPGPVADRLDIPCLYMPITRPKAGEEQGLELGRRPRQQQGRDWQPTVVGEDLHQHFKVGDVGDW